MCLAWSEMARSVFESAPDGLVPPEQQIDRLNRVAPVHPGPPHPPQADVVAGRMQATWPFFGACRLTGSEERSAAAEHARAFSPRSLSIFRPCRSSRQGAVLLGHAGVSLHGNAKHIPLFKELPSHHRRLKSDPDIHALLLFRRLDRPGDHRQALDVVVALALRRGAGLEVVEHFVQRSFDAATVDLGGLYRKVL